MNERNNNGPDSDQGIVLRPPRPGVASSPMVRTTGPQFPVTMAADGTGIVLRPPRPGIAPDVPAIVAAATPYDPDEVAFGARVYRLKNNQGEPVSLVLAAGDDDRVMLHAIVGAPPKGLIFLHATRRAIQSLTMGFGAFLLFNGTDVCLDAELRAGMTVGE